MLLEVSHMPQVPEVSDSEVLCEKNNSDVHFQLRVHPLTEAFFKAVEVQ